MTVDWGSLAAGCGLRTVEPADPLAVAAAEERLGVTLPHQLRDLYAHSNGLRDEWGYPYLLPVEELPERREELRQPWARSHRSFEALMPIGQLGNGDLLMHPVTREGVGGEVVVWDHEDDSRTPFAPDLVAALERLQV